MTNPKNLTEADLEALANQFRNKPAAPSQEEVNAALQQRLGTDPAALFNQFGETITSSVRKEFETKNKPLYKQAAMALFRDKEDFDKMYQFPSIKDMVNKYVDTQIAVHGQITPEDVEECYKHVHGIFKDLTAMTPDTSSISRKVMAPTGQRHANGEKKGELEMNQTDFENALEAYTRRSRAAAGRKLNLEFEHTKEGRQFIAEILKTADDRKKWFRK